MSRGTALALVFLASAAVLVLEIMAGRLLAPYVGVTLETFTGIIGTVLAGISLGAWLGGRMADRRDPGTLLGPLLLAGAGATLAAPAIVRAVGPALQTGAPAEIVVAAAAGFFAPALVLSAVPPVVVKMQLHDLGRTGEVVGGFSAVGSAGAIFGTFVTGFVLVAAAPSQAVILGVGLVLAVVGGLAWYRFRGRKGQMAAAAGIVLLAAAGIAAAPPCERETAYFCARVESDPDRPTGRSLFLDTLRHSYVDLADPEHLELRYTRVIADVVAALPPGPLRVLHVGGGGFTLPAYLDAVRPGSSHLVLELDPGVVEIADDRLGLTVGGSVTVETGDARLGIRRAARGEFDLVVGDAFGGRAVPWHLTTEEFAGDLAGRLAAGGAYVMNVIDHPPLRFARAEVATLAAVFPHVVVIAPASYLAGDEGGNFVLAGSATAVPAGAIEAAIAARAGEETVLAGAAARAWADGAPVLRDDFAPVDQLLTRP